MKTISKIPFYIRIVNLYLKIPIIYDFLITCFLVGCLMLLQRKEIISKFDYKIIESLNSDLISTSISLAGFILASLTIIVTFKDSVTSRNQGDSEEEAKKRNGSDLFFLSKHYYPTVKIFYRASLILLIVFFILAFIKVINEILNTEMYVWINISALILIVTTVLRSLYLLLQIIKLQNQDVKTRKDE